MVKILIAGSYSKAGKTKLIEKIINELYFYYKIGVIKLQYGLKYKEGQIIYDTKIINENGKDTKRFVEAGALKVILIRHNRKNAKKNIIESIKSFFQKIELLMIEGNSGFLENYYSLIIFVKGLNKSAKTGVKKIERYSNFITDLNFSNFDNIIIQIKELLDANKKT